MCSDLLALAYDRGDLLELIRDIERALKKLRRGGLLRTSSSARKVFRKWYLELLRLRAMRDVFFPRLSVPAAPFSILQHVYDHHADFRFTPERLDMLARLLLPPIVQTYNSKRQKDVSAEATVAVAVVLRHLAFPERQDRQAAFWRKSTAWVSLIFHTTLDLLYEQASVALRSWPDFHLQGVPDLCSKMAEKSSGLLYSHALLDGSGVRICRPSGDGATGAEQQAYFSGHERSHVLRILGLFSLSGLLVRLFGTYPGSSADETIFRLDDVGTQLDSFHNIAVASFEMPRRPTVVGDSGFSLSRDLVTPFAFDPGVDSIDRTFNLILSRCRIPNEWGFSQVANLFQGLEFTQSLKKDWTDLQKQYVVACFFGNFVTIFEGSQSSQYYDVPVPMFGMYLLHIELCRQG
jgi:hypothetical protein